MFYPGSVYVDTYRVLEMDATTKAAALAAFQDGATVKEIIDFSDPDSAVTRKLRVRRGVLYKMTSADAPVSTYKDAIVVGWTHTRPPPVLRFKSNTTRPRKSYNSFQNENTTLARRLSARTQSARSRVDHDGLEQHLSTSGEAFSDKVAPLYSI